VWGMLWLYSALPDETRWSISAGARWAREALDGLAMFDGFALMDRLLQLITFSVGLVLLGHLWRGWRRGWQHGRGATLTRATLAWGALVWLLLTVRDTQGNSATIYSFRRPVGDFTPLLQYIAAQDDAPIRSVHTPQTHHLQYQLYQAGIRNWGLNEGWAPLPIAEGRAVGLLQSTITWPHWVITLEANHPFVSDVVDYQVQAQQCRSYGAGRVDRPLAEQACIAFTSLSGVLYAREDVWPYAFIISTEQLNTDPQTWQATDVSDVSARVTHQQDHLGLTVTSPDATVAPSADAPFYLVVRETHFPGWRAQINGVAVPTVSIGTWIGVPMVAGTHEYTFSYQPTGWTTGVLVSLLTGVVAVAWWRGGSKR
jgi:hypothetical protein